MLRSHIPMFFRNNPYLGYLFRRIYPYFPFLLPHEEGFLGLRHLTKEADGLFLDVGANDGISALSFSRINSRWRILSIEPNPRHEAALRKLKRRLAQFDYRIIGAGAETAVLTLYIPYYRNIPMATTASCQWEFVRSNMEYHFSGRHLQRVRYVKQEVPIVKLDDMQLSPSIVKIDTEGHDPQVLAGLMRTIRAHRPHLLVEFYPETACHIQNFCKEVQYVCLIYDYCRDKFLKFPSAGGSPDWGDPGSLNIFLIPEEKLSQLPIVE